MKHAILITAYKDLDMLSPIIEYFDEDFVFYIHVDKKCSESVDFLTSYSNVHLYTNYRVDWGGHNHLKTIVLLVENALRDEQVSYFHLITGADFPIRPLSEFKRYFECNRERNYLEYFTLPRPSWGSEGGLDRILYYWLLPSTRYRCGRYIRKVVNIQRKLKLIRPFPFFEGRIYGGGTYWSVSRRAVSCLMQYIEENPAYLKRFRWTSIAEEVCFPTFWINSGLVFENDSLRYIDWSDPAAPAVLTERDYDAMMSSTAFFARKMQKGMSDALIAKIVADNDKNNIR